MQISPSSGTDGSTIDDTRPSTPYDYDNKNYDRVVVTVELTRNF